MVSFNIVIIVIFKGEQAKKQFMKSNLPTPILGQIWYIITIIYTNKKQ